MSDIFFLPDYELKSKTVFVKTKHLATSEPHQGGPDPWEQGR